MGTTDDGLRLSRVHYTFHLDRFIVEDVDLLTPASIWLLVVSIAENAGWRKSEQIWPRDIGADAMTIVDWEKHETIQ